MKYMGSKARLSKDLSPIIQNYIDDNHILSYIEPFVGGANMIEHINCKNKLGFDSNAYLIELLKHIQSGWNPLNDKEIEMNKDFYNTVKDNKDKYPKHIVALCGFCATYNAKWFGGYAGIVHTKANTIRNYYEESVRNLLKQADSIKDVKLYCKDFSDVAVNIIQHVTNAVIYCDPPYENTTKYSIDNFDYNKYWQLVREMSQNNIVLCSEYNAPCDFKCIWQKELVTTLDKNSRSKAIEKLFIFDKYK